MKELRFNLFCIRWLWKNRGWENTRQKHKAMMREWEERASNTFKSVFWDRRIRPGR